MDLPRVKPSRSTEPGILNAPPEDAAEFDALVEEKWSAKMPLLFKHFGIEPDGVNAWQRLAYVLAAKHVPGFFFNVRPVPPLETRGRKKSWDLTTYAFLILAVNMIKERDRVTDADACKMIAGQHRFRNVFIHPKTKNLSYKTVLNRLHEGRRALRISDSTGARDV
jgi:hypothetical protein